MNVLLNNNNVTFNFNNVEVIFDKRYFVYSDNRWDFALKAIERYCIDNGEKGVFLNASLIKECRELDKELHYTKPENIWIIDLKRIPYFSNITFKENSIFDEVREIMKSPTIKWYDGSDLI